MVMPVVGFYKVDELPAEAEPNAFYYIRRTGYVEAWLTTSTGDPVPIGSIAVTQWGEIKGDIGLQADLVALLADKQDSASLGSAAFADASSFATAAQGLLAENAQPKEAGKGLSEQNYTLAEKQKLAGVAAGATKNRSDADTDLLLAGKVSNDDARLSDAREWSANTVTQAEAEEGAETTRRAWTSQRVRQGTTAWFTGISGAIGRTILGRGTAAEVRGDLGLGTAATTDNGVGYGQNIINSAVAGTRSISYSGTLQNSKGSYNTASGYNALKNNTWGNGNTALGEGALQYNTTGSDNTAVGRNALSVNVIGDNNTAIGRDALRYSDAYHNCGGFGYDSQVTASNQIQLGDSSATVYAYGAVQNRSDARDKAEVRDTVLGLDFINAIRPVDYKLDMREDYRVKLGDNPTEEQLEANKLANIKADGTHTRKRHHHGVIAQEVASVIDALGVDFGGFQDHSKGGGDDVLSIGYEEFIAPLIKAVQELSAKVKELEGKIEHEELDNDSN